MVCLATDSEPPNGTTNATFLSLMNPFLEVASNLSWNVLKIPVGPQ